MERYLYKAIRVDGGKKKANHSLSKFQDTLGNPNFFTHFQKTVKAPRQTPIYTRKPSEGKTGQQITQLPKDMTSLEACSVRRPVSSQASDVSSERCSDALELEWEGIELVMEEGFEMIKLCKEEEV